MSPSLEDNFERLKEKVLEKRPFLHRVIKKHGKKKLFDYAEKYIDVNLNNPIKKRQDEFLGTFRAEVSKRLGDEVADSATRQLENHYFVSTTDHHGPLCHPFFINGHLVGAAPYFEHKDPLLKNVIVLSCANVSLNNSSYPRGILFHSYNNNQLKIHKIPFFQASSRLCPVYNFRSYNQEDLDRVKVALRREVRENGLPQDISDKVSKIVDEIYGDKESLAFETFSEQITKTNFKLWKKFFGQYQWKAPNLIYIDQEELVARLIINYHLYGEETSISRILFDEKFEPLINQYFDGIMGAFSKKDNYGTYLFWGLPSGEKYRLQLWKEGKYLVSSDGSYKLELTPENIQRALEEREILPSMMMTFMVLSFYYGLKCLGGFSQIDYLTNMKNAYIKMQVDRGNYRSIEVCARAQTKEMGGDMSFAFLEAPNKEMVPATGLDLVLYGDDNTWPNLIQRSKKITLEEAIGPMMPGFYSIIYPETQRDPELSAITESEVIKLTKIDKRFSACVKIQAKKEKRLNGRTQAGLNSDQSKVSTKKTQETV